MAEAEAAPILSSFESDSVCVLWNTRKEWQQSMASIALHATYDMIQAGNS